MAKTPPICRFCTPLPGGPGRGALVAAGEKRPNALKIARRRAGGERCKQQGKLFTTEKRKKMWRDVGKPINDYFTYIQRRKVEKKVKYKIKKIVIIIMVNK